MIVSKSYPQLIDLQRWRTPLLLAQCPRLGFHRTVNFVNPDPIKVELYRGTTPALSTKCPLVAYDRPPGGESACLALSRDSYSFHSFSAVYVPHSQHMLPLHICCNAAYLTGGHTEVKSQTITSRQSLHTYHLSEAALCVCFLNVHASLHAVQIGCTALFIKNNPTWFFLIDTMKKSTMEYILMPGNIAPVEGQTSHRWWDWIQFSHSNPGIEPRLHEGR